jgi:hypothetical protein
MAANGLAMCRCEVRAMAHIAFVTRSTGFRIQTFKINTNEKLKISKRRMVFM